MSQSGSRGGAACLQVAGRLAVIIADMKIINLLYLVTAQAFYKWAMREINPLHPDVPRIMLRQQELSEQFRRISA
ncbi:MAG: hypothetical protein JWP65_1929 [Ramlibacter sp.]|jgi:hypothetical protein|uniref:hypothetical protein n=1 Tax=Ramlibacter sp. TaxID=1917967 RepID=UPI002615392C|nr:hypothetical protein [Ramlibacter sp.]MDB5751508.1 hypothetical protein [Ramlibacter sp.]